MDIGTLVVIFIILTICSAFFSASETAFFSLNKIQISMLNNSERKRDARILKILKRPRRLLITVLLGNTLVNVGASTSAAMIAIRIAEHGHYSVPLCVTIQIIVTTLLLLMFGEVTPKMLSYSKPITFSGFASLLILGLETILYPILIILEWISHLISKKDTIESQMENNFTSEDFKNLITSKSSNHPLDENEKKIIASIFRLSTTELREIIVPRVDIVAVEENSTMDDLRNILMESGYSRIPVYREHIDDIVGMIYAKDLILSPEKHSVKQLMRQAYYVTENMKVQVLLNQFKSRKLQIAIVVDEYGGTSGLITLEDIMEELVGEIQDEFDEDEPPMLHKLNDKDYIVNGMYGIGDLNHEFGLGIDTALYDNIADYLLAQFNRIPKRGESITIEDKVNFIITNMKGQRIHYVKMRLLTQNEES
ncbi:MAG TPA: hemolysin family protein [Candidatus Cloacimonadota bacterium]|nr:hemolysin family protein [Candidatus Cloacimonadota bacterium]